MNRTIRLGRQARAGRSATVLCLSLPLVLALHQTQGG
jgi:hypothetical protein